MSRYILHIVDITQEMIDKINESYSINLFPSTYMINYGFDHAIYYWIDFIDNNNDEDDGPILELCSLFNGLTGHKLGMILDTIMPEANPMIKDHIHKAHMDLPF